MGRKFSPEVENEIINLYETGNYTQKQLSEKFNCYILTIGNIIRRKDNSFIKPNKKYEVNEDFFENINDEQKSYWLGFLYADGYVRMKDGKSGHLKLKLKCGDKNHIELFRDTIESNHKIVYNKEIVKKGEQEYICESNTLNVYSTKLTKDLFDKGCVTNKTFIIKFPFWLDKTLVRHFIRGYFDGDGSINKVKNRDNSFVVRIAGNDEFISNLHDVIREYGIIPSNIHKSGKISILHISRINEIKKLRCFLYDNISVSLDRKKIIFDKIK